ISNCRLMNADRRCRVGSNISQSCQRGTKMKQVNFSRVLAAVAMTLVAGPLFAANVGIATNRTIVNVQTYTDYAVIHYTPASSHSLCSGSLRLTAFVIDYSTNSNNKALYNAALAAFLMKQPIGAGITDSGGCHAYGTSTPRAYRI